MSMSDEDSIQKAQEVYKAVFKKVSAYLSDIGFSRKGTSFWKESADKDLFAGLELARPPGRTRSKRIVLSIAIYGGARTLHELNPSAQGIEFKPGAEAAQYSSAVVEGQYGKEWTLFPSTNVEALALDITERIRAEVLPLVEILLDRNQLSDAIETERVSTGGPLIRDLFLSELKN
jgi:hypothetical protein